MTIPELISRLHDLDVKLWYEEDRLRINAPKGVLTPDLRAELARQKAEILEFLRSIDTREQSVLPPQPVPRNQDLELSFAQQRLLFIDQLAPGKATYNIPGAIRIKGPLQVAALENSLNEIIQRHETLRTNFVLKNGQAIQVIRPAVAFSLPIINLESISGVDQEAEIERLTTQEAQRPFVLAEDLMLRARLLQLSSEEYLLMVTMHHIASDGWSMGVFVEELATLYQAFSNGNRSPLPALPIQYVDYAYWQREWLQGDVLEKQLAYWQEKLGSEPPVLDLLTDRPRPPIQTHQGALLPVSLSPELTTSLKALSQQEGVTLYMTLLAAFQTLLYRYTGQDDIAVGSPVSGRFRPETEDLIGFFVNTLVLRTDFSGDPSFQELLSQVRQITLEAFEYQDIPFERLVDELNPSRNLSYSPFFQTTFVLQNLPTTNIEISNLILTPETRANTGTAKFDLSLALTDTEQGLTGFIEYNSDLFDKRTISRMIGHYAILLGGIVSDPGIELSRLPMLGDSEKRALLAASAGRGVTYPATHCLHHWFEEQAAARPDAIAVVLEQQHLTYHDLNTRANQLAHHLTEQGIGPNDLVAMYLDRSLAMIIGILGILKAGGAYLPLDPLYPGDRIAFMLADSQAKIVLTEQALRDDLPPYQGYTLSLDSEWDQMASQPTSNPTIHPDPQDLAYVIYTSGSTGKPKGCQISHHNVVRLLQATQDWYHFDHKDTWSMFHSYAFDFSVWEIWGALCYGGKLIIVPYWVSRAPDTFYTLLVDQGVTVLNQTPSAFKQLISAAEKAGQSDKLALRYIIFGGEALDLQSLSPWIARHGDQSPKLINMYGITETTVHVTYRPISQTDLETATGSVIGEPIPDLQLYILDQHQHPVPIGVAGEMYVGGAGLAKGYLNRPDLTAERFIANPYGAGRLYRTGDLARYLSNGDIAYLGRLDQQVQLRGYRIELGEIEAVLVQHPGIEAAVVLVQQAEETADHHLLAYLVAEEGPTVSELRAFVGEQLPDYMVPSVYVQLTELPLTANGKLDRKALMAAGQDDNRLDLGSAYTPPETALEREIVKVLQETLQIEQVGIHDNFFDLGANSMLLVQVHHILETRLQRELPIVKLFQHASVSALARHLSEQPTPETLTHKVQQRAKQQRQARKRQQQLRRRVRGTND